MPELTSEQRTSLASELIYGRKTPLRIAISAAIGLFIIAIIQAGALFHLLPLKETQAYLAIVDKDTGIAERAVSVEKAIVEHSDAIVQSILFSYVSNRESYDSSDNKARLAQVFLQSSPQQRLALKELWENPENPRYPPTVYGKDGKVSVEITNVTQTSPTTAQVQFIKKLEHPGVAVREGKFIAAITYAFVPEVNNSLNLVWRNPYGFAVTSYRTSAITVE